MRARRAGVVNPYVESGDAPRSLPAVSDFTGGVWPGAYWRRMWGGTPWVFRASGSQVILDVRSELGMGADGRRIWTPAVADAVWARVVSLGAATVRPSVTIETGVAVPVDWLRLALWVTYDGHNPLSETQLPLQVRAPIAGVELPATDGHQTTQVSLNTSDLAVDPFRRVYEVGTIDVNSGSSSSSSSNGKWVLAAALLLLLTSGKKGE